MEPAAPGTEDDTIDFNALTKKETENKRLLKQKAILRNGQYENIFELSYVSGAEHWFCKVCECPIMGRVYQHEIGRRHTSNLHMTNRHLEKEKPREILDFDENVDIEVAPGEPIPPGMEGEVTRQAQIQERLDGFKVGPLVALEYLIEMHDYDPSKEPLYLCILCDKRGDPRTVLTHLASYNHISQYMQKHFPTCYRALAPYMTKQYKRNWQVVLHKIAEAIEMQFGRLKPFCIEQDKFEKDRMQYLTMISKGKHFSEQLGPTFIELVVHEELTKTYDENGRGIKTASIWGGKSFIEKPFQKRSPSPPAVAPPTKKGRSSGDDTKKSTHETTKNTAIELVKPSQKPEGQKRTVLNVKNRRRSLSSVSSISSDEDVDRKYVRNRSPPSRIRRRSPLHQRQSLDREYRHQIKDADQQKQKLREKERLAKMEEFKKLCKAIENDLEKTLKNHEKNPEKHPKYNDEWKLFWNRRYKELQSEGKDATKYDFKPEWIDFWGKKMLTLHKEEMKNRKEALRKRLGLPEEQSPISFRIGPALNVSKTFPKAGGTKETKPTLPMAARPDNDPEVILIDDKDDKTDSLSNRSHSPWERESPPKSSGKSRKNISAFQNKRLRGHSKERRTVRSRDDSSERRRSLDRRSHDRLRRSRSRDSRRDRMKSPVRSVSKDRRSRSHDSHKGSYSKQRDYRDKDRRGYSRERSREKERYRASSFMRDLKSRDRIRTVADLPWEKDKIMYSRSIPEYDDYYGAPSVMRDIPRSLVHQHHLEDVENNDDVNIVSVLRLLTALEEKLGSLGPKIIDLLAQALALEKKEANSSESLLDNEINCVMFETVKEKLKGQLLAGLVDTIQERAFKRAIQKTAKLIHVAGERKKKVEQSKSGKTGVGVSGVGAVDKAAIAKQLANALIAQGKTDVTQNQLEQLINAVVGMAEASRAANRPITTAAFLAQLTGGNPNMTGPSNEKIIIPRVKLTSEKMDVSKGSDIVDLDKLTEPLSPSTPEKASSTMENLSDSDLQTLLQNFKDLSADEQMNLINYLKKLEFDEPDRVERLRKFVNLGSEKANKDVTGMEKEDTRKNGRDSPFSTRLDGLNPDANDTRNKSESKTIHIDSEEEDYSYEDVVKAASKNIIQQEIEDTRKRGESPIIFDDSQKESNLTDAKALISNLMSSFSSNASSGVNLMGLTVTPVPSKLTFPTSTSSADFVKNLGDINMDNLARIVSSVQKASQSNQQKEFNTQPPGTQTDLRDERSDSVGFPKMSELQGCPSSSSSEQTPFNQLSHQGSRGTLGLPFRGQGSMQAPRGVLAGPSLHMRSGPRPMGAPIQGYPNASMGSRGGPPPANMFNQKPQYPDNFGASNSRENFQGTRPGRPLLNLTFGAPRLRGPNPRGPGPNNFNRW